MAARRGASSCVGGTPFDIPDPPGIASSIWDATRVGLTIPIENDSSNALSAVQVTGLKVSNANVNQPALPVALGDIDAGDVRQLNAQITDRDGHVQKKYHVLITGVYGNGCAFSLAAFFSPTTVPNSRSFPSHSGVSVVQHPRDVVYPPTPPPVTAEPNAETPILIPPGPLEQVLPATPTPSPVQPSSPGGAVSVDPNTNSTSNNAGIPPDPNAARGTDDVVLATYNTGISYSLNGGTTFTDVNLSSPVPGEPGRTSFFPQSDGGLCCDQVVVYLPQQNLFVWSEQYWPVTTTIPGPGGKLIPIITTPNRQRIAWATPQAIKANFYDAWTYIDLTSTNVAGVSSGLGVAANEWMDYPDLAFSSTFLYFSVDHGFPTPGKVYAGRRIVARLSLADITNPAATTVGYNYSELSGSNGLNKAHLVQGSPNSLVTASLDSGSKLRVFSWPDANASPNAQPVPISTITNTYNETAPDGSDWYSVGFPGNITGATYHSGSYIFAFDGGTNTPARPHPYVRLETVTTITLPIFGTIFFTTEEYDIWNASYAYGMAAIGTQGDEIGISVAAGGGTLGYPQIAVGYKGDFVVYSVTASNAAQQGRFGDYLSVRPIPGDESAGFAAESYDVLQNVSGKTCAVGGCRAVARYSEFRRNDEG